MTEASSSKSSDGGIARQIVAFFLDSKLTPLLALFAAVLGVIAVLWLPREEEPQINVTVIDMLIDVPATPAAEVEHRVVRPLEQLMRELPGVEYIYATSRENQALLALRFYVGYPADRAIVEANAKVNAHLDELPIGVAKPLLKVRSIDDVPMLTLTLWSETQDHYMLRRLAAQLEEDIKSAEGVNETHLFGGQRREVRVLPDRALMHANGVMPVDLNFALSQGNYPITAGDFRSGDAETKNDVQSAFRTVDDVAKTQVKNYDMVIIAAPKPPLRVEDVASVVDGPGEPRSYVYYCNGRGRRDPPGTGSSLPVGRLVPAVTISVAKMPGTGASAVADRVLKKVEAQKGRIIPADVHVEVTRNYGETATEKTDELLLHMGIAVFSVTLLICFFLGWRESLVVAIAIPVTLALTLSGFYFLGYTLNRITLFALIFSIGILVDDPIVDIENIVRHLRSGASQGRPIQEVVIEAVNEVRSPLILATLAVMVAIVPMAFVRGLMGPYMRPIPVGATCAMMLSMASAFVVTPWAAVKILGKAAASGAVGGHGHDGGHEKETAFTRFYRWLMGPLLHRTWAQALFLGSVMVLLGGAIWLIPMGQVRLKMLPFDNKSEFQVVFDMPDGTSLERTAAVAKEMAAVIADMDEVRDVEVYAGIAAPFNFNGLIRHYYMRKGPALADLQVNLTDRHERSEQSHEIAKRVRERIRGIAERHAAKLRVVEVPPGPPVVQTLVAEIYGPDQAQCEMLAEQVKAVFRETDGVVDVDDCRLYAQKKVVYEVDRERAALHQVDPEMCAQNLSIALNGRVSGVLHDPREREQVDVRLQLAEPDRSSREDILSVPVRGRSLQFVPLGEMVTAKESVVDQKIYHKNLLPVSYVMADVAGAIESPAYAIQTFWDKIAAIRANPAPDTGMDIYFANQPASEARYSLKWDGELHVTCEVFRDLGLAFACGLVVLYLLLVTWFRSYLTPIIILAAIPFSLIGILPAHALMGAFFSATSMIGFIAGSGIVVRNSIILVDFIEQRVAEGHSLEQAVVDAGAIRFRPMLLTALAVVVGASVILADPIFQGLAISLMAGEIASLLLSRMAVPILYFMAYRNRARSEVAAH